ncbi:probable F-box protein involved in pathogenicity [Claviceps purpurea 20.1]|uniref:Probable F-box protein involved in pathogenicity n=1 Tax=Claviceps purpurea (strain 20.1) TaxID=1111077 RepID=M1VZM3_CLAP2|nr:probable F-box protein involved in pathogenicity [Claviceps purpurea 20.1]
MAGRPARAAAMDPPHITEFASERYFEKLNQSKSSQQTTQQSSTFSLPLRRAKNVEPEHGKLAEQKRDKSRFFGFRHKVSSKPQSAHVETPFTQTLLSIDSAKKRVPFDQAFLALPTELQVQILSSLPLTDILSLRLASKTWHLVIMLNEAPIVRHHLDTHIPAYALRLYPVSEQSELNFHYICSLWHRLHVAAKLAFLMCEWITKEIFLRQTEAQQAAFAPQRERMRRRLIPLLFTTFHFFETYRKLYLKHIVEHDGHGLKHEPYTLNPIEAQIMNMYDGQTLLRVHEVFPLVISSFCRRLRPPTYVGRVERSLRGYLRERPSDDVQSAILCIGGLRQVERLWEIKGYNNRRSAIDQWYNSLTKDSYKDHIAEQSPVKSRLARKSFGRKKSSSGDRPATNRSSLSDRTGGSFSGSIDATNLDGSGYDPKWIFHTSLAADAPMSPLSREYAQILLDDLPVLQQIWLTTAEALILARGIVQRPQDIKRNQQVMLELIREDGLDEEDEWLYGRNNPDSVRPPATSAFMDDDAE